MNTEYVFIDATRDLYARNARWGHFSACCLLFRSVHQLVVACFGRYPLLKVKTDVCAYSNVNGKKVQRFESMAVCFCSSFLSFLYACYSSKIFQWFCCLLVDEPTEHLSTCFYREIEESFTTFITQFNRQSVVRPH